MALGQNGEIEVWNQHGPADHLQVLIVSSQPEPANPVAVALSQDRGLPREAGGRKQVGPD